MTKHDFAEVEWFGRHIQPEYQIELRDKLRALPYEQFLKTWYWHAIKAHVVARDGYRCRECHARYIELQVHHKNYEWHGVEHLHVSSLRLLCDACHKREHGLDENEARSYWELLERKRRNLHLR